MVDVTFSRAAIAGLISMASPCGLPLIPFCASIAIALPASGAQDKPSLARSMPLSFAFVSGFLFIFALTASATGAWVSQYQPHLRIAGGALAAAIGAYSAVIALKTEAAARIPGLFMYPIAVLTGAGFASGWTPHIGPTLGAILINTSTQGASGRGVAMLIAYLLGFGIALALISLAAAALMTLLHKNKVAMFVNAAVSVSVGIILITDNLRQLTRFMPDIVNY